MASPHNLGVAFILSKELGPNLLSELSSVLKQHNIAIPSSPVTTDKGKCRLEGVNRPVIARKTAIQEGRHSWYIGMEPSSHLYFPLVDIMISQ